ncbi:MAG: hypothetical protein J5528_02630 [Firmicutes bacterium]|nr:hypothetical protein [Bacillota bacterium]
MSDEKENKYEDIIMLPHHVSEKRHHMSNHDRAAQFAPFAALTGFEEEIDEAKEQSMIDNQ